MYRGDQQAGPDSSSKIASIDPQRALIAVSLQVAIKRFVALDDGPDSPLLCRDGSDQPCWAPESLAGVDHHNQPDPVRRGVGPAKRAGGFDHPKSLGSADWRAGNFGLTLPARPASGPRRWSVAAQRAWRSPVDLGSSPLGTRLAKAGAMSRKPSQTTKTALGNDPPFWTNQALLARGASAEALGLTLSLVVEVYRPGRRPFAWDPDALLRKISAFDATRVVLDRCKDRVANYFLQHPDGRWEPSPMFFRLSEPDEDTIH